jgi:plasmid stability protein
VKNITVSLPDEAYRQARIRAAERDTSVSALVREFLMSLAEEGNEFDRRKRLQDETIASIREFRAADRLTRDEIHDRDAVR